MWKTFNDYKQARNCLEIDGGWLLDLGSAHRPVYGVTDDESVARDLRGQEFIDRCENLQCWDETELSN